MKFANALALELDSGETVLMRAFQPPSEVVSRSWLLPRRHWIAGDLLALTSRRLLWITDRERGSYSRYGSIASYAPFDAVLGIGLTSGRGGDILQVDLNDGSAWQIPIAWKVLETSESRKILRRRWRFRRGAMKPAGQRYADSDIPPGDPEVRRLLACLQSLVDGQSAIEELVACGPRAIPPLREFLLSGRITSVPQPRMWAVEALALLEARDVLIEYLQAPSRGVDAQLQFAEDAVKNTAGRRLSAWRDNETFEFLLEFCKKANLPGVIETMAEFERPEAIPCLDRALEDDMCRIAAEDGLRRLGPAARQRTACSPR